MDIFLYIIFDNFNIHMIYIQYSLYGFIWEIGIWIVRYFSRRTLQGGQRRQRDHPGHRRRVRAGGLARAGEEPSFSIIYKKITYA